MDMQLLVEPDIKIGERVAGLLSADRELKARAVLWWFVEDKQQWFLAVSTPLYEHRGLRAAYLRIRKLLEENDLLEQLPLERLWVIDDRHPLLEMIRDTFGYPTSTRFSGNVVNGMVFPDLYVYKIEKRRAGSRKKTPPK